MTALPPRTGSGLLLLLLCAASTTPEAQSLELDGPLILPLSSSYAATTALPTADNQITVTILLDQTQAPVMASLYLCDDAGQWYQEQRQHIIQPGHPQRWSASLEDADAWATEPGPGHLSAAIRPLLRRYGLVVAGTSLEHGIARLRSRISSACVAPRPVSQHRLLELDGLHVDRSGVDQARTGERWSISLVPSPFPSDPYDPASFALSLEITFPDGHQAILAGFYDQPMSLRDGGDREIAAPSGNDRFLARWRPQEPGLYHLTLRANWQDGQQLSIPLPPLLVEGPRWNAYVRCDASDKRFFCTGVDGRDFAWPVGLNLQSATDHRANSDYQTVLTPDLGTEVYAAYFARLAAAGGTAAEIWLCSWNTKPAGME